MQDYKENLRIWAKFAVTKNEKDSAEYSKLHENLTLEDTKEMLAVLAGYFGATAQGKELLSGWL